MWCLMFDPTFESAKKRAKRGLNVLDDGNEEYQRDDRITNEDESYKGPQALSLT